MERSITALEDENAHVRRGAALKLGSFGDERGIPSLVAALEDEDHRVRRAAKLALDRMGQRQTYRVQIRIADLKDREYEVKDEALRMLGLPTDTAAVEPIVAFLQSSEPPLLRREATETLGRIGDARAVQPLIAALDDQSPEVRKGAATALGTMADSRAVKPLIASLVDRHAGNVAEEALRELIATGEVDPTALDSLVALLQSEDKDDNVDRGCGNRDGAARLLLEVGGAKRALVPLMAALTHVCASVRSAAAGSVGKIGDPRAVEPLIRLLADEDEGVRSHAATVLGRFKDRRTVDPLIGCLRDDEWKVRRSAAEALGRIEDPRAVEPLILRLMDEKPQLRQSAAEALGRIGDERAVLPLLALYRSEKEWMEAFRDEVGSWESAERRLRSAGIDVTPEMMELNRFQATLDADSRQAARWAAGSALRDLGFKPTDRGPPQPLR